MEEILASIRRIIEDSDPARSDGSPTAFTPVEDDHEDDDDAEAAIAEVESFRAEFRPQKDFSAHSATPRLAEVQASLRDGGESAAVHSETTGSSESERSVADAPGGAGLKDQHEQEKAADNIASQASYASEAAAPESAEGMELKETGSAVSIKSAIISDSTGRKVAAAFEELNEALEASRRRSLDQMAEEMLRPMLQEWLDNNLPTLVEKLVREEIERVARGGVD
ncbi:MAG TPA: PopZ family protein [Rhizobiaceae bacterium]|nr:PopZ family protein [Rhizobiaceae bacterium]